MELFSPIQGLHRFGCPNTAPLAVLFFLSTALTGATAQTPVLDAEVLEDRVVVKIDGAVFTEYVYGEDLKYPHFYPVNGPRSAESVTVRRTDPFPHHSSLFFSCDRVNGGNYWQQGLDRGRIDSKQIRLLRASGSKVVFEQDSRWERPYAPPPFSDHRVISIQAPSADLRIIDFDVTLTALVDVTIEKTNHSLFSARMAPDLAVNGGGTLLNDHGRSGEKETFGIPAHWMDARGNRGEATEGLAIFSHPDNRWSPSPWFTRDYGFFSPTPTYWWEESFRMAAGEKLRLRYRVLVHADNPPMEFLEKEFQAWATGKQ